MYVRSLRAYVHIYVARANTITLEFEQACGYMASYITAILTSIKCTYVATLLADKLPYVRTRVIFTYNYLYI